MNVVCLVGRLTAEPELKTTPNGSNVCSFSVAVNRVFTNANGERQTDFINCVAWRMFKIAYKQSIIVELTLFIINVKTIIK